MTIYQDVQQNLKNNQSRWLITGVAGFIGSNLLETLLKLNQKVVGLDNFSTGHQHNLDQVRLLVGESAWQNFHFIEGVCGVGDKFSDKDVFVGIKPLFDDR